MIRESKNNNVTGQMWAAVLQQAIFGSTSDHKWELNHQYNQCVQIIKYLQHTGWRNRWTHLHFSSIYKYTRLPGCLL